MGAPSIPPDSPVSATTASPVTVSTTAVPPTNVPNATTTPNAKSNSATAVLQSRSANAKHPTLATDIPAEPAQRARTNARTAPPAGTENVCVLQSASSITGDQRNAWTKTNAKKLPITTAHPTPTAKTATMDSPALAKRDTLAMESLAALLTMLALTQTQATHT